MPNRSHRRRIVLFLVAIVVPSLVLVVLSLRMISQERELTEKRLLDEQHRRTSEIRQELLTHLERIKLKQVRALAGTKGIATVDYGDPELVFAGLVENNQLVLPWEQNPTADEFQQLLAEPAFARRIQQGEQEELAAVFLCRVFGNMKFCIVDGSDAIVVNPAVVTTLLVDIRDKLRVHSFGSRFDFQAS